MTSFREWLDWWRGSPPLSEEEFTAQYADLIAAAPIPTLWLLGKTGSGKSSVVRFFTQADAVEIGSGFRPQTTCSSRYDFPDAAEPLVTFLDTRGLGEAGYDPTEDIAKFSESTQLILVTVRVMDHALEELVDQLRTIRKSAPERPVALLLTCLHQAYPGEDHPEVDPFPVDGGALLTELPPGLPENLFRSLQAQRQRFAGLVDAIVPIDLTPAAEGFLTAEFGGERLRATVLQQLPQAYRQNLLQMEEVIKDLKDQLQRKTRSTILAASSLAGTAAAVPLPWVDIPVVMAIQTHLAYRLAAIYDQQLTATTWAQMTGAAGGRIAIRMALREFLKVIPWVGMAANAAAAFAYTYASGMAWDWYFTEIRKGHVPQARELEQVFKDQLARGATLWSRTAVELKERGK